MSIKKQSSVEEQLISELRKTKVYNTLFSIPWKLFLDKKVDNKLDLSIAIFVNPCYGFGDIVFALKIYRYIQEWYNIDATVITTKPKSFLDNGIKTVLCAKIPNKEYKECDNTRKMQIYNVDSFGNCQEPIDLGAKSTPKFDLIFAAPWIGTDYEPDYKALKPIIPYANKFNTFLFSEYNAPDPQKYDFPTGLGDNLYGLLLKDTSPPLVNKTLLRNPFIMVHLTQDFRSDIEKCFSGFVKLMCKKYSKTISNLDMVVPKYIANRTDLITKLEKYIRQKGYYQRISVIQSKNEQLDIRPSTLTLRADITPLPHKQYTELFHYALPDVLITGDQSVTDIISCCKKYNIYYQIMPWKRHFAKNLSLFLDKPDLKTVSTACGLEKMSIKRKTDSEKVFKKGDFRRLGKPKLDAILLAKQESKTNVFLQRFMEIVLSSRKIKTVISKLKKISSAQQTGGGNSENGIAHLPLDLYLNIINESDPDTINKLCQSSKQFLNYCSTYKETIAKIMLKKYKVNYQDPTHFIYIKNKRSLSEFKKENNKIMFSEIYNLYLKDYFSTEIKCEKMGITGFPMYPNLKFLHCRDNMLTTIPSMPELLQLRCNDNLLTELPQFPKLISLHCDTNQIKTLPPYPQLKFLSCELNELKTLPMYPKLIDLFAMGNQLRELQAYPGLQNLYIGNNNLTKLPKLPFLQTLSVSDNQLSKLPEYPNLVSLTCNNNRLTEYGKYPKLKLYRCSENPITKSIHELI